MDRIETEWANNQRKFISRILKEDFDCDGASYVLHPQLRYIIHEPGEVKTTIANYFEALLTTEPNHNQANISRYGLIKTHRKNTPQLSSLTI
jgi:hypothetical protein